MVSENLNSQKQEKLSEQIWGGVTDPNNHNPKNFRYLVHAFNPYAAASQPLLALTAESNGYRVDKSEGDQSINLFNQPERLGERVSLSMSLIDQDHTGTWGEGGIIVEAPDENIVITSPYDIRSLNSSPDFLRIQANRGAILSGDELLEHTSPEIYNEVVAFARSEIGKIKLKGFFIKVDRRTSEPTNPYIASKMMEHALRLGLPLVRIPVQGPYEQEMIEITEGRILAQYKGNLYNLGHHDPKFAFYAYDYRINTFFPSPEEIKEVVKHFLVLGKLDQDKAQQILENYKIADSRRRSPIVEYYYDEQTGENKIKEVIIKEGYGDGEIEYWFNSSGYCYKVNMKGYRESMKEGFLSRNKVAYDFLEYQTPLSASEVLSILESRRETMENQEEYNKLRDFFAQIQEKIDDAFKGLTRHRRSSF